MHKAPVLALLVLAAMLFASAAAFRDAPVFNLDLDAPPRRRWSGAASLVLARHEWDESFGPLVEKNQPLFEKLSTTQIAQLRAILKSRYASHYEELLGLADEFKQLGHPEVNEPFLVFWAFFHEVAHAKDLQSVLPLAARRACTGILAVPEDPSEPIIHGRNLDQSISDARNVTLQIEVTRGGKVIYQAVDFYWMGSGFMTAQSIGGMTFEENWRSADLHPAWTITEIIATLQQNGTIPQLFMFRHFLEKVIPTLPNNSPKIFTEALNFINHTQFAAPFYGIMSGPGRQGAVIGVSTTAGANHVYLVNNETASAGEWFLVQTNYDRWQPDPPNDNRRTYAQDAMSRLGRSYGATRLGVWMAISEYPVHNADTFYTVIMGIDRPTRGFIREAMLPVRYQPPK